MMNKPLELREISKQYDEKLKKIKLCIFDVDGILTDGRVYWAGEEVGFNRFFHVHDGYGMKILSQAGIEIGIITGGDSLGVVQRFKQLGVKHVYMGNEDKRSALEDILEKTGITAEETLYMGDEFFDLPVLQRVGFAATVPNASDEVREAVDYVTRRESGRACAREVMDMLRYAQNITPEIEH